MSELISFSLASGDLKYFRIILLHARPPMIIRRIIIPKVTLTGYFMLSGNGKSSVKLKMRGVDLLLEQK